MRSLNSLPTASPVSFPILSLFNTWNSNSYNYMLYSQNLKSYCFFFQVRLFATNWCYAYNPVRPSMSRWWPRRPAWVSVWRKRNWTSPTIPVIKAPDCPTLMKGWFSTVLSAPKCTLFVQVNVQSIKSTIFKKFEFFRQNKICAVGLLNRKCDNKRGRSQITFTRRGG